MTYEYDVVTHDYGTVTVKSVHHAEVTDEGILVIPGAAAFARGSWAYLTKKELAQPALPEPEPRVWESLADIPKRQGITVRARDGSRWRVIGGWYHVQVGGSDWIERNHANPLSDWDGFGPFTEVVDGG